MSKLTKFYGSEWHMLRMLGRHRRWFTDQVEASTGLTGITWQDFDFTEGVAKNHGDAEIKGMNFLPAGHPVRAQWNSWWPQTGNVHNWDAVGECRAKHATEYLLVEAKGNIGELRQSTGAKSSSEGGGLELIEKRLLETQMAMGLTEPKVWTTPHYQYANRLALLQFLQQHGVSARLVFIYFTGDTNPRADCPTTTEAWNEALKAMKIKLGLSGKSALEQRIHEVFLPVAGSP